MITKLGAAAVAVLVMAATLFSASPAEAEDLIVTADRIIGGPGHAGLYGWGAATMSDGSVLIGDYWNYRVQRYDTEGRLLGTVVPADGNHQAPFDVAVDQRDDSVYIADTDGGRNIDKYNKEGNYLFSFGTQQLHKYPSWLDVDSAGRVAVADGHDNKIVVYDDAGNHLYSFGQRGSAPGDVHAPRGVGFDADDNLYVADVNNDRIQVFELGVSSATYLREWTVPGDFRGLTVDQVNDWVYLVNTSQGVVQRFDLYGGALGEFGGWGTAPGKFLDGGRDVTVDGDGNVWVGDMPNFRAQKFTPDGDFLLQAPNPAEPPPPGGFALPGSAAVDPSGNIFVVDTYNWRIQKLANDGSFITQWGRRGGGVDEYGLNYPRGVAVDPGDGSVIVADTDDSYLKKYTNDGVFVWGSPDVKSFALSVSPDGTIYAADFGDDVVKVLSESGSLVDTFGAGQLDNPRGIEVDADGTIWVASRGTGTISHFTASGNLLAQFGSSGSGDEQLSQASDIESNATHVFVADQSANKIKVWAKDGTFSGAFGGGGSALGRLSGPIGMDMTPAGDLYVTEMTGERVQVFSVSEPAEPDAEDPDGTVTTPTGGQNFPGGDVVMMGDATDNTGVTRVDVAVKDATNNVWWNGSGWGGFTWIVADLTDPSATTTSWGYTLVAPPPGSYGMTVRAKDAAGNVDSVRPWVSFAVSNGLDQAPPDGTVTAPTPNQVFTSWPVALSGTATDDIGVVKVEVALKDTVSGLWWTGSGWGGFTFHETTLGSPGDPTSDWSWDFDPGSTGSFALLLRAKDAAGNVDPTRPWVRFTVSDDGTPPDSTVTSPARQEVLPLGAVDVAGTATDDMAVARVEVAVRDTVAGLWWTGSDWGSFTWHEATLDDPGSASTDWAWSFDPGVTGSFGLVVKTDDTSSNTDPSRPWIPFSVE